jgi:hypothetical protein
VLEGNKAKEKVKKEQGKGLGVTDSGELQF